MKLTIMSTAVMFVPLVYASSGVCQQNPQPERPYLLHTELPRFYFSMPPTQSGGRVELVASSAQLSMNAQPNLTSSEIESVLQLSGNVEVRLCAPSRYGCEKGSLVLHADAVDYNESTREIDAHGDIRIIPDRSNAYRAPELGDTPR